jgi:hypothetical protein
MQTLQISVLIPSEYLRADGTNFDEWLPFLKEMIAYGCHDLDETAPASVKTHLPKTVRAVRARIRVLSYCEPALQAQIRAHEEKNNTKLDVEDIVAEFKRMWNK